MFVVEDEVDSSEVEAVISDGIPELAVIAEAKGNVNEDFMLVEKLAMALRIVALVSSVRFMAPLGTFVVLVLRICSDPVLERLEIIAAHTGVIQTTTVLVMGRPTAEEESVAVGILTFKFELVASSILGGETSLGVLEPP